MEFRKATRQQSKLRLALSGPSGSGKTYSALLLAKGLGERVCVIDTERGSASLYSHLYDFDTGELAPPFAPEKFIEALRAAEKAGYGTIIIDSITHEWNGSGGCLEINDTLAQTRMKGNTWAAWNETTPRHRAFLDAILQSPAHIIATMRSKTETAQEGRQVVKLGMKNEQRDGTEYEFTIVLDLLHNSHMATASKDRSGMFSDSHVITPATGERLRAWLSSAEPADTTLFDNLTMSMDAAQTLNELDAVSGLVKAANGKLTSQQVDSLRKRYVPKHAHLTKQAIHTTI